MYHVLKMNCITSVCLEDDSWGNKITQSYCHCNNIDSFGMPIENSCFMRPFGMSAIMTSKPSFLSFLQRNSGNSFPDLVILRIHGKNAFCFQNFAICDIFL